MNMKNESVILENIPAKSNDSPPSVKSFVSVALALWFGLVYYLGSQGAFVGSPGSPPLAIFMGVVIPVAVFLAAYFGWSAFRTFILSADLRLVAAIQAWRWAGLGFLSLYANGVLPGLFTFPAGFGDMAIGVTAPWIMLELIRRPSFAASRRYMTWNILGIVDFVIALSTATLSSGIIPAITRFNGNVTMSPMAHIPLVLIPAFMVPFFTMSHLTALFQSRRLARSGAGDSGIGES